MDRETLHKVYNEYIKSLFDYGFKISKDKDLVVDEIHDLFLYFFEKETDLHEIRHLKAYLFTSLRRRIFKRLASKKQLNSTDDLPYEFAIDYSIESRIVENEISIEIQKKIEEAFKNLSARQKEIIHLKYFENLSNEEIQETMNLTDQATRNLLSKTLRKLRESFPDTRIISVLLIS
jgi:RNA polymerase sigma factor (sigma-70 family)